MIEVEIKIPISNAGEMIRRLTNHGFRQDSFVLEEDKYYDNETGQIRGGHQALRIRKITDQRSGDTLAQVTFKDRKLDQVSVTRPEYETEVADAEAMEKILNGMGYHAVDPIVRKLRRSFALKNITACVDEVEDLGPFLELETVIPESENREAALAVLEQMLDRLGLSMADTTRTSYLSQLQKRKGRA